MAVIVNLFQRNTRHHTLLEWAEQLHSLLNMQVCYNSHTSSSQASYTLSEVHSEQLNPYSATMENMVSS